MSELSERTKWSLTSDEQQKYISALAENLAALRAKVGVTQVELANLVGVCRQTYAPIETGKRRMSWTTYLALILFYDYYHATHQMIRDLHVFPGEFVERFNNGASVAASRDAPLAGAEKTDEITRMMRGLDAQGKHTVSTVLGMEYARCQRKPSGRKRAGVQKTAASKGACRR